MTITKKYLESIDACKRGIDWFCNQPETDDIKIIERLISEKNSNAEALKDANWFICRLFDRKQKIQYAVFAAEQVIDIFEKRYPNDDRPKKAVEAAKKCIENDTEENRKADDAAAADAATAAADDAAAADAATAAADDAAAAAAYAAAASACAASAAAMRIKILQYGISLLQR